MRKRKFVSIAGIATIFLVAGYFYSTSLNFSNLQGQLVLDYSVLDTERKGIDLYDLKTNKSSNILSDMECSYSAFSSERNKFVVVIQTDGVDKIYEYDNASKSIELIVDNISDGNFYSDVRYVPNKNAISYKRNDKLFVYDLIKKSNTVVSDCNGSYSWDKTGEFVLFDKIVENEENDQSNNDINVVKYNIQTSNYEMLFEGMNPEYSSSNRYIAYSNNKNGSSYIIIKDVTTGEEWKLDERNSIDSFRFSPDERYLAYSRQNYKSLTGSRYDVVIWDFKKGKTKCILRGYSGFSYFDWMK